MKENYKRVFILSFIFFMLIVFIINSNYLMFQVLDYTKLFITKLFPAVFIFFILASLLIDYGFVEFISKIFHVNGAIFYVILMSIISGFPSGSKYIRELLDKKIINLNTANYLISFTHFPNPLFVFGTVNQVVDNNILCIYILISLIGANILIGIITNPREKTLFSNETVNHYSFPHYLSSAINSSLRVVVLIYGTSLFFFLISTFIIKYINLSFYGNILISGLFDLTKGVISTNFIPNIILKCIFIISFISFGSISIHMQVKNMIESSGILYKNFFVGRIFQIIISSCIFIILYFFFY